MKKLKLLFPIIALNGLLLTSCDLFNSSEKDDVDTDEKKKTDDTKPSEDEKKFETDDPSIPLTRIDASIYNENATITNHDESFVLKNFLADEGFIKASTKSFYDSSISYSKKLALPSHDVNNVEQFADVLDYYAFYGNDANFVITLTDDYKSPSVTSIISAFYKSKLCASTVGLNYSYYNATKKYKIQMLFNNLANTYKASPNYVDVNTTVPYAFPSNNNRSSSFNDFPYLNNSKGEIDVYNSEQLLYALENNYIPVPLANSPAETLLSKSKDILRSIIKTDMTKNDKLVAIYTYLIANNSYDRISEVDASFFVEEKNFPDFVASSFRSFYAEGGIIDGQCVCHGFAKSFNVLANIEGFTSIKVSARSDEANPELLTANIYADDGFEGGGMYSNHGYSYVLNESDNKYYIVDPTYAYSNTSYINGASYNMYRRPAVMKSYNDWTKIYNTMTDTYHTSLNVGSSSLDLTSNYKIGNNLNWTINSLSDLGNYLSSLSSFMSSFNDTNYKTNTVCYSVNITVKEIEDALKTNPNYISNNSASLNNTIQEQTAALSNKIARISFNAYSSSDTGLSILLKL